MGYWLMLVLSVVLGGTGTIRLSVPLLSMACLGVWLVLVFGLSWCLACPVIGMVRLDGYTVR